MMQKQHIPSIRWPMIIIICLAFASLLVWSMVGKDDSYYSGAYREVIHSESLPGGSHSSVEPHSMGLKESEVRKNSGKGFSVY